MAPLHTSRTTPARLVIADDHELARMGLRAMLADERGFVIVGEASNGYEALELCTTLEPDLAIIDVRMPGLDGLATTRLIKKQVPRTSVLIMTLYASNEYILEAIRAGAAGYLLKDVSRRELIRTIRQIISGESVITDSHIFRQLTIHTDAEPSLLEPLTPREREILVLVAKGLTNREIAELLIVSAGTVKNHVAHIIAKLGVSDRTQAAVQALQSGLIAQE